MTKHRPEHQDVAVGGDGPYANQSELSSGDRALLESAAADLQRDPADREPGSLSDDDAVRMDIATQPVSDETAVFEDSDDDETIDGLSNLEESVRRQAEDRATGDDEEFEIPTER